ncbi:MAG: ribonuclease HII [Alphaproteobacteria bacterium]
MPDFALETTARREHAGPVAGIDEAGRGPWAGPVVAAAVILDADRLPGPLLCRIDDSKRLTREAREAVFSEMTRYAAVGIGVAEVAEIDAINILQATMRAMGRAVEALGQPVAIALVDGNRPPPLPCAVRTVVGGDGLSLSIAAASIVAKVTRDRMMADLAGTHPGYGWERNAGYGTPEHSAAMERLGITVQHRRSFAPVAKYCLPITVETQDIVLKIK